MTVTRRGVGAKPAAGGARRAFAVGVATANMDGRADRHRNGSRRTTQLEEALPPDQIRVPHFSTIRQWQARSIVEAIGVTGSPAAALNTCGEIIAANSLFEALVPSLVCDMYGRPRLTDPVADRLVGTMLDRLDALRPGATAQAIPIRGTGPMPAAIAYISPVSQTAREVLLGIGGILMIVPFRYSQAPNPRFLQEFFGLSAAQARVASCIAAQMTVEEIADEFGVARETVRSQLKAVLAKTGTKRQLDLALLLTGLQLSIVT